MAREPKAASRSPVLLELSRHDTGSVVALVGHPIHAMLVHFPIAFVIATLGADLFYWWAGDPFWMRVGTWSAGIAFLSGLVASLVGTAELLLVAGIRVRAQSWSHAVAALSLLAVTGTNWGLRLTDPDGILPHAMMLSAMAVINVGFAGWHGGKLVFDHGIGVSASPTSK